MRKKKKKGFRGSTSRREYLVVGLFFNLVLCLVFLEVLRYRYYVFLYILVGGVRKGGKYIDLLVVLYFLCCVVIFYMFAFFVCL